MKAIILANSTEIALVDDEDFQKVDSFNWYINNTGYAMTGCCRDKTEKTMHYLIVQQLQSRIIDHINGNKLDNRKLNLRYCNYSQNNCNRPKQKNNKSGYKGVYFDKSTEKWIAQIKDNPKLAHSKTLGRYNTAEKAAEAYNRAALKYHGEFAFQNII